MNYQHFGRAMLFEIVLALVAGIIAGIITGLTPGIHVNLITALLISIAPGITPRTGIIPLTLFIIAMATTHTFLDALPSIFLGAPEAATALGVLPGHRYLLRGWGLMAVKLTIIGSLASLTISGALFPLLIPLVKKGYPYLRGIIGYVLIIIALFTILKDRKKGWAALIFILSGITGYLVLNTPGLKNPLFPLLSGLFGVATLIISLNTTHSLPQQYSLTHTEIHTAKTVQACTSGTLSGFITALLPGVGAATAAVMSMQLTKKIGDHGFMILMGGVNTANFVLSLVTLQALGKARNGALIAVKNLLPVITPPHILIFLFTALTAGGIASIITLIIGRGFARLITRIPYRILVITIILFIILITPLISGFTGIIILITTTALGILPAVKKTSRTTAMGCLLLPVITYFV